MKNINSKDLKILEILKENSREKNVNIAKKIGISEAAVRKKIKKLEKLGIIKKYTIEIDYKKLGFIFSFTGVDVDPDKMLHFLEIVRKNSNIKKIWLCSGDHTYILLILVRNAEELESIHKDLEKIEGVKRICPAIVLEEIENVD